MANNQRVNQTTSQSNQAATKKDDCGTRTILRIIFVLVKFIFLNIWCPYKISYEQDRFWKTFWIVFLAIYDGIMTAIILYLIYFLVKYICLKKKPPVINNQRRPVPRPVQTTRKNIVTKPNPNESGQFTNVYSI